MTLRKMFTSLNAWYRISVLRIVRIVVQETQRKSFTTNVAALTYTSVLAVVPLLALILALGRGFGLERYIEVQLRAHLNVQEHVIGQLMEFANSYIARTQDDMIIGVSFLFLAFTLISLVNNIEEKFNALWGVGTSRGLFAFSLSYLGLIVFLIFSIFFLSGVWLYLLKLIDYLPQYELVQTTMPLLIFALKWLTSALVFMGMYKYIPCAPVRWQSVWLPSLLAGGLFCAVQQFYIQGQMFLSSYNAVYGSFAVLPLLMVWIYATWTICLGGVLLCQIIQNAEGYGAPAAATLNRRHRDVVALGLMRIIARRFVADAPPCSVDLLSRTTRLSPLLVESELDRLVEVGALYKVEATTDRPSVYKVDTDVHQLTAARLLERLDCCGTRLSTIPEGEDWQAALRLRNSLRFDGDSHILVKDL